MFSEIVEINGNPMYYERRGTGSHILLLIPGALGTGNIHFQEQHSGLDLEKFTLITVDLVGYGKSRLGIRQWDRHYWFDAECCHILMREELKIDRYSIIGFSDGGRIGLIMGILYPTEVEKIVAAGCSSFVTDAEKRILKSLIDLKNWNPSTRAEMEKIYGNDLQSLWSEFVIAYTSYTNIFKDQLSSIKCPVFILHGENDNLVLPSHANYFHENLPNSQIYIQPEGTHALQITHHVEFNKRIQKFLLE